MSEKNTWSFIWLLLLKSFVCINNFANLCILLISVFTMKIVLCLGLILTAIALTWALPNAFPGPGAQYGFGGGRYGGGGGQGGGGNWGFGGVQQGGGGNWGFGG